MRTWSAYVVVLALVAGVIAVGVVLLRPDDRYTLRAQFVNSGRLVEGGNVRVAGHPVGRITKVDLAPNGLAEVTMSLPRAARLTRGTRAEIRAVGAATLTNNFVELVPGPSTAPRLPDGAELSPSQTSGIVDVDAILDALDPATRKDIGALLAGSADVFAGSGAAWFNAMLAKLSPALGELRGVASDLSADQAQLADFVSTAAEAATAVRSRRSDLAAAVEHTATTMSAISRERRALASVIDDAPAFLRDGRRTLDEVGPTVAAIRPALRLVPPAARRLTGFLDEVSASMPPIRTTAADLHVQLPHVRRTLRDLPALRSAGVPALRSTGRALRDARPILRGMRFYAPDFLIGIFNGLLTIASGNYNKYGHYIHASFVVKPQDSITGSLAGLFSQHPLLPGVIDLKTGLNALCPGAAAPPAPDGSNDYVPDPALCEPTESMKASVNTP
jgi:phospholipid/cholesterol/gamma-HCH transport system substrate-binding protein